LENEYTVEPLLRGQPFSKGGGTYENHHFDGTRESGQFNNLLLKKTKTKQNNSKKKKIEVSFSCVCPVI